MDNARSQTRPNKNTKLSAYLKTPNEMGLVNSDIKEILTGQGASGYFIRISFVQGGYYKLPISKQDKATWDKLVTEFDFKDLLVSTASIFESNDDIEVVDGKVTEDGVELF